MTQGKLLGWNWRLDEFELFDWIRMTIGCCLLSICAPKQKEGRNFHYDKYL